MTVRRIMGLETEYGISVPGLPNINPLPSSTMVVSAYGQHVPPGSRLHAHWD